MSAFVVGKPHIDAMIQLGRRSNKNPYTLAWYHNGTRYELQHDTEARVGRMLIDECVKSVSYRYPSATNELPGPVSQYWQGDYTAPSYFGRQPTPLEGLKLISCYEYQSCEHPEWPASEAAAFCVRLRGALIAQLPGYDDAPWEWTGEARAAR